MSAAHPERDIDEKERGVQAILDETERDKSKVTAPPIRPISLRNWSLTLFQTPPSTILVLSPVSHIGSAKPSTLPPAQADPQRPAVVAVAGVNVDGSRASSVVVSVSVGSLTLSSSSLPDDVGVVNLKFDGPPPPVNAAPFGSLALYQRCWTNPTKRSAQGAGNGTISDKMATNEFEVIQQHLVPDEAGGDAVELDGDGPQKTKAVRSFHSDPSLIQILIKGTTTLGTCSPLSSPRRSSLLL